MDRLTRCLAVLLAIGAGACADTSRCDAALASVEKARVEAQQRDVQITWLRMQLATFAAELHARSAADRDLLLQRLSTLQAENAALAQRIDRAQIRAELQALKDGTAIHDPRLPPLAPWPPAPPPVRVAEPPRPPPPPVMVPPPAPAPRAPRQVDAKATKARGIDEASPY